MDLSQFSTPEIAVAMVFTGLVVVFVALIGLWAIVAIVGKAFISVKKEEKSQPTSTPPPPKAPVPQVSAPSAMNIEDGIGDEIVAVIAAAVTAMSGGNAVIHSVKRVREGRSSWSQAGVLQNTNPF